MNLSKLKLIAFTTLLLIITSCSDDDSKNTESNYTTPESYVFERNRSTTVDFSGQSQRILMLDEMATYVKNQATTGLSVDNATLNAMYSNSNNPFSASELNTSGKQIKNKTAASLDYFTLFNGGGSVSEQLSIRSFFESQFTAINTASQGTSASNGVAGKYGTGVSTRYFSANGLEPVQVFLKGVTGASFLDQVVNNYLSVNK